MGGAILLDGQNLRKSLGATLLKGSLLSLLSPPSLKEPPMVDWAESDGVEVDLHSPAFAPRAVTLQLHMPQPAAVSLLVPLGRKAA